MPRHAPAGRVEAAEPDRGRAGPDPQPAHRTERGRCRRGGRGGTVPDRARGVCEDGAGVGEEVCGGEVKTLRGVLVAGFVCGG